MPKRLARAGVPRGTFAPDQRKLEALGRQLLKLLGENPTDPRVVDTPRRWAKMWREFLAPPDGAMNTAFAHPRGDDQAVVVRGMRVWSMCEHHLLPFWCDIAIGYVPRDSVLGLSKFGRIAHAAAHKLQLQERLVREIADRVHEATGSQDVAVLAEGEHLCMTMRGIKTPARMISSVLDGRFREAALRAEFISLARNGHSSGS
jgi:GTP cyclohydrolase I